MYGLDELIMKDVLIKSLDDTNNVNIENLARSARYEFERDTYVQKAEKNQTKSIDRNTPTDPVDYFKSVSPIQLLNEIGDNMVSVADLRTVERLIDEVGISPSVVSVLLAYIARTKEGVLPGYAYFQKVGQTWKRNQINTVELAMDYVKHLESRRNAQQGNYYKNKPKDVEIDWLEDYINNME